MVRSLLNTMFFAALLFLSSGCGGDHSVLSPDEIIRDARLDLLSDEVYLMPANMNEEDETVFLPLRKWDIIFVGSMKPGVQTGAGPEFLSLLIPGKFDHILVYVGKDNNGNAYAEELNTDAIRIENGQAVVIGGTRFMCLGKDFGEDPHPSGAQVLNRDFYGVRWAKTFRTEDRMRLLAADKALTDRVTADILGKYPYQLEFRYSGLSLLVDRTLSLVDDGLRDGAGCADYWTNVFEDYAGLCMKGVRETAQQITDYYLHDPVGRTAYVPAYLNPLGTGDLPISLALSLGLRIVNDTPHRFSCDGTEETGLVLPDAIFESAAMQDIQPVSK
ncbi:MAG TPA: hypothetical protein VMH06_05700 [Thermodesulfovibrionales bacterium]|nr:hypothetical protein [Thermodesulfovibrionales bacterium]